MDKSNVVHAATKRERWQADRFNQLTSKGRRKWQLCIRRWG